jgi:hypothetical protein
VGLTPRFTPTKTQKEVKAVARPRLTYDKLTGEEVSS